MAKINTEYRYQIIIKNKMYKKASHLAVGCFFISEEVTKCVVRNLYN